MENSENIEVVEKKTKSHIYKKWWFWVIIAFVAIAIIAGSSSGNEVNSGDKGSDSNVSSDGDGKSDKVTVGEANALRSAKNYLRTMPFSKMGLKKQLEFEGYTETEAAYAVDNCGANWKDQAAKSAKNYLDIMPFSKKELIDQLEFEGYTTEEATYGVEQAYK